MIGPDLNGQEFLARRYASVPDLWDFILFFLVRGLWLAGVNNSIWKRAELCRLYLGETSSVPFRLDKYSFWS